VSEPAAEAAARLRAAGLGPLLEAARRKVEAVDGLRGTVVVDALSPAAREALAALVGWRRAPGLGPGSRLALSELDAALRRSRYGVGLLQVLAADGGPLVTRSQRRQAEQDRWQAQLARIAAAVPPAARWLVEALEGRGPLGRGYRRLYREDPAAAERVVLQVARALTELPARRGELLALFAARITGDAHAFDRTRPAGALLAAALRALGGPPAEGLREAEAWALLLSRFGLETDALSSAVLVAHLRGSGHPVLEAMAAWGGGWPVPLAEVRELRLDPAPGRPAWAVENPQVFAYLVRGTADLPSDRRPVLLGTGGFLSAAAVRLLDALQAAGYRLHYGGDFDRSGLAIARDLGRRYPGLTLWRMGPEDYARAVEDPGGPPLPPEDGPWLEGLEGPLGPTARAMRARGLAAYQERLAGLLLEDLRRAAGAG
jgi:uncharacterized protein (TIGR02679 family)